MPKFFWGGAPPQTPPPLGRGYPLPRLHPHRRLRRLHSTAFGTRPPRPPLFTFLNTPLQPNVDCSLIVEQILAKWRTVVSPSVRRPSAMQKGVDKVRQTRKQASALHEITKHCHSLESVSLQMSNRLSTSSLSKALLKSIKHDTVKDGCRVLSVIIYSQGLFKDSCICCNRQTVTHDRSF